MIETLTPDASAPCVLVVDDDAAVRAALGAILGDLGYAPVAAADGAEALLYLRGDNPRPCAIVLDLTMPGMNGWEFCDIARHDPALRSIPIIVSSSEPDPPDCEVVVPKPVHVDAFTAAVEKVCPRRDD